MKGFIIFYGVVLSVLSSSYSFSDEYIFLKVGVQKNTEMQDKCCKPSHGSLRYNQTMNQWECGDPVDDYMYGYRPIDNCPVDHGQVVVGASEAVKRYEIEMKETASGTKDDSPPVASEPPAEEEKGPCDGVDENLQSIWKDYVQIVGEGNARFECADMQEHYKEIVPAVFQEISALLHQQTPSDLRGVVENEVLMKILSKCLEIAKSEQ